jgi:hypothetical protein
MQNDDVLETCVKCGLNLKNPTELFHKNEAINASSIVPIGRSGLSIIAGYLGLFALVPILAPISLFVSILALHRLQNDTGKLGKGRAIFGLLMGFFGTIALIYLLLVHGRIMY